MSNKLLGQHFLKNAAVTKKIVEAIDVQKKETIIEVGAGHGELTWLLAEICAREGAHLIAIEKDVKLADDLRNKIDGVEKLNTEIVADDALDFLKSKFLNHESPFKIIGNIPYYLTGYLLRTVSELQKYPDRCVFMVQKEVAERMGGGRGEMNRLAANVQFWADVEMLMIVPKEDFSPSPKVDSAVIILDKKQKPTSMDTGCYFTAMRVLFAQPRKTIINNLISGLHVTAKGEGWNKELIAKELKKLQIAPNSRPQDLSVELITMIAEIFFRNKSSDL